MSDQSVRIRMYRQGLGDCFLLTFPQTGPDSTRAEFHMLIDCGVLTGTENARERIQSVVSDIFDTTGGVLDLVVATHEHWDHVSGFVQARELFDRFQIRKVWLAWTEDPDNAFAQEITAQRQEKVKALQVAVQRMADTAMAAEGEGIRELLGFFGPEMVSQDSAAVGLVGDSENGSLGARAGGGTTREAMGYLAARADASVHYCYPSREGPYALPGVDNVRVYVFGPPEDPALLKMSDPTRKGKETYGGTAIRSEDSFFASVLSAKPDSMYGRIQSLCYPFDDFYQLPFEEARTETFFQEHYGFAPGDENEWRRIDEDWLSVTGGLALNLDNDTNNTSLVLAIELGDPGQGKVLLFSADAQVGNWLSWGKLSWTAPNRSGAAAAQVSAVDLLKHTVLYKVGHHGSHNATLRDQGLELMDSEALVAMIPVDKGMAEKRRWNMPFPDLYTRIQQKTRGRVLRIDSGLPAREDARSLSESQWQEFLKSARQTDLYLEYWVA